MYSGGLDFFSHPSQSKNVTSGAYRYQEGCSVSAQVGAFFFFFLNGQRLDRCELRVVREVFRAHKSGFSHLMYNASISHPGET